MPLERSNIRHLQAYVPGEQPAVSRIIKLNTNENPYPPSQAVLDAIAGVTGEMLRKYPPPAAPRFRQVAAAVHGVEPACVLPTNGGDELLRLAITVFCEPRSSSAILTCGGTAGDAPGLGSAGGLLVAEPSYSLYPVLAAIHDTPITRVSLGPAFELPDDFAQRALDVGARLVLLVNPHAPSGRFDPSDVFRDIAAKLAGKAVVMIDEAYVDFADADALSLVRSGTPNIVLLRTLSKGYSLAGLRFGYGLGHPLLIAAMEKARDSYNTDAIAQVAAVAALEHRSDAQRTWHTVVRERSRMTAELRGRGWQLPDSQSNFVLATPPPRPLRAPALPASESIDDAPASGNGSAPRAKVIFSALAHRGIFVRYFDQDRLRDRLRITVGTPQQNDALLAAIDEIQPR